MAVPASFSGTIPENYDRYLGPYIFEPYAAEMAARVGADGPRRLLEIACGTGRVTVRLLEALPAAEVTATDINPDMLVVARLRVGDSAVRWEQADAERLPYAENSFDAVVCQFGLMFVPDKALALREAYRVLRPGGRLYLSTWDSLENNPAFLLANEIVTAYFPEEPPRFFLLPFSLFDDEQLSDWAREAGFDEITVSRVSTNGESASAGDAARGMLEGSPIHTYIVDRNPALLPAIYAALTSALARHYGATPLISSMQALFVDAIKLS